LSSSKAWYLLPIFFGLLGGLLGWYLLRKTDNGKAKLLVFIGLIPMAIYLIFMVFMLGLSDANGYF
jgi:hypothetical protein